MSYQHEAAESLHAYNAEQDELRWRANEDTFNACYTAPYIRYKTEDEWTIEDAERLHSILKILFGRKFQVVRDETLYEDTDWIVTGVREPALKLTNRIVESALTSKTYDRERATQDYNNYIAEMGND